MTEQTLNQYAAPRAHVADMASSEGTGELKLFSAKGRIGRLRYLAYAMGASIIHGALIGVATIALMENTLAYMAFSVVALLAVLWFSVITGIKRCHDLDMTGWWTVTIIIPVIALLWIFVPGTKGANRFGPPPPANTWGVRILAWILPFFFILGIVVAIALPAYKGYTDRARAVQAAKQAPAQQAPAQQP
jgi:uncharacterized membrane protein YhaH (DUF805 family)